MQNILIYDSETFGKIQVTSVSINGVVNRIEDKVISENLLDVYIDDVLTMKVMCTPVYLKEMVLGYLYSEGMVRNIDEVKSICIDRENLTASIKLNKKCLGSGGGLRSPIKILSSNCARNRVNIDEFNNGFEFKRLPNHTWRPEWIFALGETFNSKAPLYKLTRGAHGCLLIVEGEIICLCEDNARHNAMDKAIGYGFSQGLDFSKAMLYTSGRIQIDMVAKVIRSGIPVLISHTAVSMQAIEMAKCFGLTLIGKTTADSIKIFHDASNNATLEKSMIEHII